MFPRFAKSRFQEEFLALTVKAGHGQPSPFERRVLPFVFGGRNLAIETPQGQDVTAALVLATLSVDMTGPDRSAVVLLTESPDLVRKLSKQLRIFVSNWDNAVYGVALGIDENIKKELQLLAKPPDIVVGTPERLIDHIRRENLSVADVRRVVIDLPGNYTAGGFDKDVLFIHSKLPKGTQTILFCPSLAKGAPLPSVLKRPLLLPVQNVPQALPQVYRTQSEEEKIRLLIDIFFAEEVVDAAVVCRTRPVADKIVSMLGSQGIATKRLLSNAAENERSECEAELRAGAIRAVVTDSLRRAVGVSSLKRIILYEAPSDAGSYPEIRAITSEVSSRSPLVAIAAQTEPNIFEGIQEVHYVDTNNNPSNDDILTGKIRSIVRHIKEESDPEELNRLRRMVRRNVPIFLRGYFMAYMVKQLADKPSVAQDMKTLFVSIGKNRRVFPRDLSRLFSGALDIKASSIGNIKVLDNYSFIDIPESLAEKAISALDGKDFRGRKITVNHARKKEDE